MKHFYTIDDIVGFIYKNLNHIWDGKVTDMNGFRNATLKDFNEACKKLGDNLYSTLTLRAYHKKELGTPVSIEAYLDDLHFKTAHRISIHDTPFFAHYDEEWQDFLFEAHPEEYAETYITLCERRCKEILDKSPVKGVFRKRKVPVGNNAIKYNETLKKLEKAKNILANIKTNEEAYGV